MAKAKETLEEKLCRKVRRIEALLYVFAAGIVILFSLLVYGIHQNQDGLNKIHKVACTQKKQLEQNISGTESFLRNHPKGIPGVPNKLLLRGLQQNKEQLKSLGPVSCS